MFTKKLIAINLDQNAWEYGWVILFFKNVEVFLPVSARWEKFVEYWFVPEILKLLLEKKFINILVEDQYKIEYSW